MLLALNNQMIVSDFIGKLQSTCSSSRSLTLIINPIRLNTSIPSRKRILARTASHINFILLLFGVGIDTRIFPRDLWKMFPNSKKH